MDVSFDKRPGKSCKHEIMICGQWPLSVSKKYVTRCGRLYIWDLVGVTKFCRWSELATRAVWSPNATVVSACRIGGAAQMAALLLAVI